MFVGCGCHCWPEGESSLTTGSSRFDSGTLSSFGSSLADPPGRYPRVICDACVDDVAPAAYEVVWNYNGQPSDDEDMPRPCCSVYTGQSTFKLYASKTISCSWSSLEQAATQYLPFNSQTGGFGTQWLCSTTLWSSKGVSAPRVNMFYGREDPVVNEYYAVVAIAFGRAVWDTVLNEPVEPFSTGHGARYYIMDENDEILRFPQNSLFCLVPRVYKLQKRISPGTLERGPMWTGTNVDGQGVPYGSPCKQVRFSGFDFGLPDTITVTPVGA